MKIAFRYFGLCVLLWFVVIGLIAAFETVDAAQRDDLTREEQVQLMKECQKDAGKVFGRLYDNADKSRITVAFFEYRTRR